MQQVSGDLQKALQSAGITSQEGMQQAGFGQQTKMQTGEFGQQTAMQQAQSDLQKYLQSTGQTFTGQQATQQQQFQASQQVRDIDAQMGRLQTQLASTDKNSQAGRDMQWQLAQLQNTRDIAIQTMQGQQAMGLEGLRGTNQLSLQDAQAQQQQWGQVFGASQANEMFGMQSDQQERMAELTSQQALEQALQMAGVNYQNQYGLSQLGNTNQLQQIQEQGRQSQLGQAQAWQLQAPYQWANLGLQGQVADTNRIASLYPLSPAYQNAQSYNLARNQIMQGVGGQMINPQLAPNAQQTMTQMLAALQGQYNYGPVPPAPPPAWPALGSTIPPWLQTFMNPPAGAPAPVPAPTFLPPWMQQWTMP